MWKFKSKTEEPKPVETKNSSTENSPLFYAHEDHASLLPFFLTPVLIFVVLGLFFGVPFALKMQAQTLANEGNHRQAVEKLEFALKFFPLQRASFLAVLGKEQSALKNDEQAQKYFEEILMADPVNAEASKELGLILAQSGSKERAFSLLEMSADKNDPAILKNLAELSFELKKYDSALNYSIALQNAGVNSSENLFRLGFSYQALNNFKEAKIALSVLIQQYPKYPQAHALMGKLLTEEKEFLSAAAEYKTELGLMASEHPELLKSLMQVCGQGADYYLGKKDKNNAMAILEFGVNASSSSLSGTLAFDLARIHSVLRNQKQMFKYLSLAVQRNPELKPQVRKEKYFSAYQKTPAFKKLVK